jgi:hypothetical protein
MIRETIKANNTRLRKLDLEQALAENMLYLLSLPERFFFWKCRN